MSALRLHKIQRDMLARFPVEDAGPPVPLPELDEAAHQAADAAFMHGLGQTVFEREVLVARLGCVIADGVQVAADTLGAATAPWVNGAKHYALRTYFDRLRTLDRTLNRAAPITSKGRLQ